MSMHFIWLISTSLSRFYTVVQTQPTPGTPRALEAAAGRTARPLPGCCHCCSLHPSSQQHLSGPEVWREGGLVGKEREQQDEMGELLAAGDACSDKTPLLLKIHLGELDLNTGEVTFSLLSEPRRRCDYVSSVYFPL